MKLTRPQERLLTALALDVAPYFDQAKHVYSDGRRVAGRQWPSLLALHDRGIVRFMRSNGGMTEIELTDQAHAELARLA